MKFFLGTGLFAWFGLEEMIKAYPETESKLKPGMPLDVSEWWNYGFCPSNPKSREINLNYCLEMADEFSEADGFFLEMRDEWGPCVCKECDRIVGEHGEKGYGASKASFLEELSATVWKRHPNFKFVVCIGYIKETGEWDIAYYDWILKKKSDPRWIWLNARWTETYPGLDGKEHPFTELSDQIIYLSSNWTHSYALSVMDLLEDYRRWKRQANYGICYDFSPGFRWMGLPASKMAKTLESISTKLYRMVFKEFWRNPEISNEESKETLINQLFKPNEDKQLLIMLFSIHQLYLGFAPYAKLREKVNAIDFFNLHFHSGLAGFKDRKSVEKALRDLRDYVEKNKPLLSKVHSYLETKKLTPCTGLLLLKEGKDYCKRFTSENFLKKLDLLIEYYEFLDKKTTRVQG